MRIAVCGGPYGNPYALRAFVADARDRGCERLYCLGDLGGFGAEVDALWPILTGSGDAALDGTPVECVAGNYDVAIARGDTDCGCGYRDPKDNEYAQLVYDHTLATTSRDFAAWMGKLPTERRETIEGVDVHMVHGSTLALNDFWWESLPEEAHRLRAETSGADVVLCTHSGLPWQRRIGDTLAVNVGVLGKPANDGRQEVWYAVLDLDDGAARAELIPLAYDWRAQARSMRAAGLPGIFAETIETGWWTTCLEILPPAERSRGRFHLYRSTLPTGFRPADDGWGPVAGKDAAAQAEDRPVVPLFGTAYFPSRLWLYTNFHCNLACDYCAVASSPTAAPRTLPVDTFHRLLDEAVTAGFTDLYLTGGEPFLHPAIIELLDHASAQLPTVVLTNAMLLRGRRAAGLEELAGRKLTLQTSLDGATAATHDRHRGAGSWARTMDGIRHLISLGLPPRVALTETADNGPEIPAVGELLAGLGLPKDNFAVRPMLRRGFSEEGMEIGEDSSVPELTVSADGLHWHPAGADLGSSPDMRLAGPGTPLERGKELVTERFFAARLTDGSLPRPVHCAI
ncbi:radical SAM protein [Streptomyces sp. N2-109]|uniref:Radical SAM protein n=1 Tax=Streptomyces gossypii TaxID=2883101 RepID=A0ABT2JN33_9ACTN|nr:radical SAM protein [Streptomyces gossypii]MCT2589128.1 radical SAM protein [Streptomyces gossypii]